MRIPRLFLLSILCCFNLLSFGQFSQKQIDSLAKQADTHKIDTFKVAMLNNLVQIYIDSGNPDKAFATAKQTLALAETLKFKEHIGLGYASMSTAYNAMAKYKEAIAYQEKALIIFKELALTKQKQHLNNYGATLYTLGQNYYRLNDWPNALSLFNQAYEIAKQLKQPFGEIACLSTIGDIYDAQGEYNKELENDFKALKIAESIKSDVSMASCYANIANVYYALGDYEKSLSYNFKSLALKRSTNHKSTEGAVLYAIGAVYDAQGNTAASLDYYTQSLKLSQQTSNKLVEINALTGLGNIYYRQGNLDEATNFYQRSLKLSQEINEENFTGNNLVSLSTIYIKTGKYDLAESFLNKAYAIFKKLQFVEGRKNALEQFSELYAAKKEYNKALTNYKSFVMLRDSVVSNDIKTQAAKKEMQFDFDKKESVYQLNAQLNEQKLTQQHILAVQQQQQLLLQKQKLSLSDKEKSLQRLTFLAKQADLENDRKLQASNFKQAKLQAKYETSLRDKQITKQNQQIKYDLKVKIFLFVAIALALLTVGIIFYNQRKASRLNQIINVQKGELEHLNKVKDRIFGVVSHDMRAPVNSLISFIHLLEDGNIEQEKLKVYAASLKNNLTYTSTMMENLLNWAASQMQGFDPKMVVLNVHDIANNAIASLKGNADEKKIILQNLTPADTTCRADANMLNLVIYNMVGNAIKFTPNGGSVTINANHVAGDIEIKITDTGTGMSAEQVLHFNKPGNLGAGVSTLGTNKEKGTGLGLLLCRTFISLMDGSITANTNTAKGSQFIISLRA